MPNRRFNTQVAQPRKALADGGKVKDPSDKRPMARRKRTMADSQKPKGRLGLKPVRPEQKGLKKLPTEVRNKMGFLKKGGRVKKMKKKK